MSNTNFVRWNSKQSTVPGRKARWTDKGERKQLRREGKMKEVSFEFGSEIFRIECGKVFQSLGAATD